MKQSFLLSIVVLAAIFTDGCVHGMTTDKYKPAKMPNGVAMWVQTTPGRYSGELLEVRDSGILLKDDKIRLIPYTEIQSSGLDQTSSSYAPSNRKPPAKDVQEHLRLLSRFPYGIAPELLQTLLASSGQTELAGTKP